MVLLDTHAWVWMQTEPKRLSKKARSTIDRARQSQSAAISIFSVYELACLFERGRLKYPGPRETAVRLFQEGFVVKELSVEIAVLATEFPLDFPRDPGDRIIAATARLERIPLVTADERIRASNLVRTVW
jgi:PIN domain nuclease of toxin-antitoxin system